MQNDAMWLVGVLNKMEHKMEHCTGTNTVWADFTQTPHVWQTVESCEPQRVHVVIYGL